MNNNFKETISKTVKKKLIFNQKKVFTKIYKMNIWKGAESISGPGSDISQVKTIIANLPIIINEFKLNKILDISFSDFYWIKHINIKKINYIGGDIVSGIFVSNNLKYKKENIKYVNLDLIKDDLSKADLLFCRDCLVHFPFNKIFKALKNIIKSNSTYLFTTIFTNTTKNLDIVLGDWRPLDLLLPPFSFPDPILLINENCTENNNKYSAKSLGLWLINDLPL